MWLPRALCWVNNAASSDGVVAWEPPLPAFFFQGRWDAEAPYWDWFSLPVLFWYLLIYVFCVTEQMCLLSMQKCTHGTASHGTSGCGQDGCCASCSQILRINRNSLHLLCKVGQAPGTWRLLEPPEKWAVQSWAPKEVADEQRFKKWLFGTTLYFYADEIICVFAFSYITCSPENSMVCPPCL